jgi:hypothetical protein
MKSTMEELKEMLDLRDISLELNVLSQINPGDSIKVKKGYKEFTDYDLSVLNKTDENLLIGLLYALTDMAENGVFDDPNFVDTKISISTLKNEHNQPPKTDIEEEEDASTLDLDITIRNLLHILVEADRQLVIGDINELNKGTLVKLKKGFLFKEHEKNILKNSEPEFIRIIGMALLKLYESQNLIKYRNKIEIYL